MVASAGLTGCLEWETEYRVTTDELTAELGKKSTRYQRAESLISTSAINKAFPDTRDSEHDVRRAFRRQELLGFPRGKLELSLGLSLDRRDAARRLIRRHRRARALLDRSDLEVYPDSDYELVGGERFVRAWNRLVDAEHQLAAASLALNREQLEYARRLVVALRAGLRELDRGGGRSFLRAVRRWRDYDRVTERGRSEDRYDRALGRWNRVYGALVGIFDEGGGVERLVGGIGAQFPRSFFAKSDDFVVIEEELPDYDPSDAYP